MTDFPNTPMPPVISSFSQYAAAPAWRSFTTAATASAAWPTNNLGIFVPFSLPAPFVVRRFFTGNQTASGNLDVGVYGPDGTLIVSKGSTAMSGTTIQLLTPTETLLPPGDYYMALSSSTTGAAFSRNGCSAGTMQMMGALQAASQLPLATAPTFATPAQGYLPLFGIASVTVI